MNLSDLTKNAYMLRGALAKKGYMRWWHSFCGEHRTTGETRTFFVEFLIMNPELYHSSSRLDGKIMVQDQPVLGQHPYFKRRGMKPSYVMMKAGVFPDASGLDALELHNYYPVASLKTTNKPFIMQIEDCFYSEERIYGYLEVSEEESRHRSFMSDSGAMEWDLEVYKAVACNTGYLSSPLAQAVNLLDSYWHGEGVKSFFRGSVTLNGEIYDVTPEKSNGYCDKHWGKSFNLPWFQFACGKLISEKNDKELKHSVLAINGCCPRFLFIPLRKKLLLQLTYTGEDYCFGSSPFVLSRCKWETKENGKRFIWHIMAQNKNAVIKISGSCTKEQMMEINYESPDGSLSKFPLLAGHSAIGNIQLYRRKSGEREWVDTLHMQDAFCEYRQG